MTTYRVEFDVEIPGEPPDERDLEAFMRFELGETGSFDPRGGPLARKDLASFDVRHVYVRKRP